LAIDVSDYYQRYGPMVLRRCRQLLKEQTKAEDAMHDVFVELLRREGQLHEQAPSSLLYRIATNVSLNRLRSERRRPVTSDDSLLDRIAALGDGEGEGSVSAARQLLSRLFGSEPESTRVIAVLHLQDGLTLEQVAEEVQMSVSGVRKRLRRLREQLQELERN
jgi:RNA polymerase sigma-70 factor (ECF subfamily)